MVEPSSYSNQQNATLSVAPEIEADPAGKNLTIAAGQGKMNGNRWKYYLSNSRRFGSSGHGQMI